MQFNVMLPSSRPLQQQISATKRCPVSCQEGALSRPSVTISALLNVPSPVLGKTRTLADSTSPWLLHHAAAPHGHKFGQTRSWSHLQLTLASISQAALLGQTLYWEKLRYISVVSISPFYNVNFKLLFFIHWTTTKPCYLTNGNCIS